VKQRPIGAIEVSLIVLTTFAAVATAGSIAVARFGAAGVLAAELGFVLVPTATWLWARGATLESLGLGDLARARTLPLLPAAGGFLVGLGTFYLLAAIVEPAIERVYPTPPALREAIESMVLGARPLYVDLCALAIAPAVAEELLFRGALYEVVTRRANVVAAVVIAAAAFALYHGSPHRFAPAFVAGVMLGVVRARSRSLVPAMVSHATNNAAVVVCLRLGYRDPPLSMIAIIAAAGLLAAGLALLRRR
jgi:membrane protease YdiL (CAAX protease family)